MVDTFALIVGVQAAAAVVSADEAFVFALLAVRVVMVCDGGHAHADERQRPGESADELDDTRCRTCCTPDIAVLSCDEKVSVVDCTMELCTSVHGVPVRARPSTRKGAAPSFSTNRTLVLAV